MICRSFMIHNDVKIFRRLLKRFALTFIAEKYRWHSYQAMKRDASAAEDDDAGSSDGMSAKRVKKTDGPMGSKGKGKAPANVSFLHKRFSHQIFYSRYAMESHAHLTSQSCSRRLRIFFNRWTVMIQTIATKKTGLQLKPCVNPNIKKVFPLHHILSHPLIHTFPPFFFTATAFRDRWRRWTD